jgi:hypothetical protein
VRRYFCGAARYGTFVAAEAALLRGRNRHFRTSLVLTDNVSISKIGLQSRPRVYLSRQLHILRLR